MHYTPVNVTTFVMLALTLWHMVFRFRSQPDSNWALFYYLFVVTYHQSLPDRLNEYLVYAGVIVALVLRFEFLGPFFRKVFIGLEMIVCVYLVQTFFVLLWG